jgi:hypothetical protein
VPSPSLVCPVPAHRSSSSATGAPSPSTRGSTTPLPSSTRSGVHTRGEHLPTPLIRLLLPFCPRDCSPELIRAAVSPSRRMQRPLVLPRQRDTHGRVRQTALNAPELFPKPLEPRRGQSPRLRRALAAGPSSATAFRSGPQALNLGRPSEIGRFRFH